MRIKIKHLLVGLGIIAVLSIALNIFLAVRIAQPVPSLTNNQYPYLDPAQAIYNDPDLLVNMYPLAQQLKTLVNGNPNIEIYFEYLNTGSDIRINSNPFYPGSLMKLPIAMAAMKKIDLGEWSMNQEFTLTDADKNAGYGTMYELPSGTKFTVSALMQEMLVESDDTARAIFYRELGGPDIENVLDYLGLEDVFNDNLEVTAQRYSNFWRALYSAGYLSSDSSQEMLQTMALPHDLDLLASGMPSSTIFSHKIGVYGTTFSDSGIVYVPDRPYILTVMMISSSTDQVHLVMKTVSADVYNYVTQN